MDREEGRIDPRLRWESSNSSNFARGERENGASSSLGADSKCVNHCHATHAAGVAILIVVRDNRSLCYMFARKDAVVGIVDREDEGRKCQEAAGFVCDKRAPLSASSV